MRIWTRNCAHTLPGGHLEPLKEDGRSPSAEGSGAKGLQDLVDDEQSAFAVKLVRDFDADFLWTGGGLGTGVVVTEGAAAHGNRLAMEPTGHYVTTFGDH
jgi:hypothetical protein